MSLEFNHRLDQLLAALPSKVAVVSPGSRNAPVIESLLANAFQMHSVVDERSAAFQALGMAKASEQAVVLSCTSGTASLNYYPAIAEAYNARIPLLVITSDRPKHQVDQWENQTIRQNQVFAQHTRLSLETALESNAELERIKGAILDCLKGDIPGPIHLNLPSSEPLYSRKNIVENAARPWINAQKIKLSISSQLPVDKGAKLLIIRGMHESSRIDLDIKEALKHRVVVLADLTSGKASSIGHWDALLYTQMRNNPQSLAHLQADFLVSTGTYQLSKGLAMFLNAYPPKKHFHLSEYSQIGDPFDTSPQWQALEEGKEENEWELDAEYFEHWSDISKLIEQQMQNLSWNDFSEFSAVKSCIQAMDSDTIVHSSNSLPVRYLSFLAEHLNAPCYANRGSSGIDGCTSTAIGHALLCNEPLYLFSGDVAFYYDINAFYRKQLPYNLKVILLNNGGGRIFDFIDGPSAIPARQEFQLTQQNLTAEKVCEHFGLKYFCAVDFESLEAALEQLKLSNTASVLEIITDPQVNNRFNHSFKNLNHEQ